MKIITGSLKYSPIYKSHCFAFGKQCENEGYDVKYIFSSKYKPLINEKYHKKCYFLGESSTLFQTLKDFVNIANRKKIKIFLEEHKPDFVYLHNYHLLNNYIGKLLSKKDTRFIYHVHEPYTINKRAHGGIQKYWLYAFEHQQAKLLKYVDDAIVSSKEALKLFNFRYPNYTGNIHQIPLMYEDENPSGKTDYKRKYITFIGPPVPAKGPDIFLKLIDETNRLDLGYKFLLVSREPIKDDKYIKENLTIFHNPLITNEEMADVYKKSIVVITPYTRATQSSVILNSYMFGTPVLSSNVGGLKEFVSHKKHGYIVDINSDINEWFKGLEFLIENNRTLSKLCRKYFKNNFSENNWKKNLANILN